jgi:hypothetical protein
MTVPWFMDRFRNFGRSGERWQRYLHLPVASYKKGDVQKKGMGPIKPAPTGIRACRRQIRKKRKRERKSGVRDNLTPLLLPEIVPDTFSAYFGAQSVSNIFEVGRCSSYGDDAPTSGDAGLRYSLWIVDQVETLFR